MKKFVKTFREYINESLNEQSDLDMSLTNPNEQVARLMRRMPPFHLRNCAYQITPWGIQALDMRSVQKIVNHLDENEVDYNIDNDTDIIIADINEKKVFSPKTIKDLGWDKNSVKKFKSWTHTIKDLTFKFSDFEHWADGNPSFHYFLIGEYSGVYGDLMFNINDSDSKVSVEIHTGQKTEISITDFSIDFTIDDKTFAKFIGAEDDKISGFSNMLTFLFTKFSADIYANISKKMSNKTLYVIPAGTISPATGKTGHGWSIYDNPNGVLFFNGHGHALYSASGQGDIKVGDGLKVLDDQKRKEIFKNFEVKHIVPTTYNDFVAYSRKMGANIPVGAYKKQTGKYKFSIYSIK